ncbi:serine kinase [Seohaeicola saemankumensis]|nr:serine kinase [Seohaeicola saemankumensis]
MRAGQRAGSGATYDTPLIIHASCVSYDGRAVLISGASGRGKSGLALQLMALGAGLVADDRTCLTVADRRGQPHLMASVPDSLRGRIEARGVGILNADVVGPSPVALAVNLDQTETQRLPPSRHCEFLSIPVPLLHMVDSSAFPAAILQYLKAGRFA